MSRVLFLGDLQGTGFGTVTYDLGRALLDRGEDVRFVSLNERAIILDDLPEPFASRTLQIGHPNGWIGFVNSPEEAGALKEKIDRLYDAHEDGWRADAVIIVGDPASIALSPAVILLPPDLPAFHYVAVEGVGLPPRWAQLWQKLIPVAMSEFGADQIEGLTGTRPVVAYHGVDTATFYPVSPSRAITLRMDDGLTVLRTKADCKAFFGGDPRHTWVFRADRNMPRKRYGSLFRSMAPLLAKYRELFLVYHCRTVDQGGDLEDEKSHFGELASKMISSGFHDRNDGAPREILNALYNAADIYASVSSEGFGLTIAEAMACGVPAVGLHFSSVPEVIGSDRLHEFGPDEPFVEGAGGLTVRPGMLVENIYAHFWAGVDEGAMTLAVNSLVTAPKRRAELGWLAAQHVARTFTWANCAAVFADAIESHIRQEIAA